MISKELLQKLTNAYIMYEIAMHGVDPRDKLEGTTMRIRNNEGYKYRVVDSWQNQMKMIRQGQLSYVDAVLQILSGVNLVSYRQKGNIEQRLNAQGTGLFENALRDLYEGNDDSAAFDEIVGAIGGYFDVVGFLFFLKAPDKYMPIRSEMFEDRLQILGVDAHLSHNCTWENYQMYNGWIDEIHQFLCGNLNSNIQKIDAHSFLWLVPGLSKYSNDDVQVVEHKKYGKGIVVGFERDLIKVRFGKEIRSFDKKDCFDRGLLKFVPLEISIYGDEETEEEKERKEKTEQENFKIEDQMHPTDLDSKNTNDELDEKVRDEEDSFSSVHTGSENPGSVSEVEIESYSLSGMVELTELQIKLAEQLLISVKKKEPYVTYSELAARVTPPIHHRNIGKNIGQISVLCHELGLPLLSAKVINKNTETAGEGFYALYQMLGIPTYGKTELELYNAERKAIRECQEWYRLEDYLGLSIGLEHPYREPIEETGDPFETVVLPKSEGKKKEYYITKYERDPKNRRNAIKIHGLKCMICGFDFEAFYGAAGKNVIEVHHVKPLSEIGKEITINPETDLVCLCANCHRIVHRKKDGVFSIEEVREMIKQRSEK